MGKILAYVVALILVIVSLIGGIIVSVNLIQAIFNVGGNYDTAIGWFIATIICGVLAKVICAITQSVDDWLSKINGE